MGPTDEALEKQRRRSEAMTRSAMREFKAPLNAAVAGARKRPLGDAFAWSRESSSVDNCRLVAATLAMQARNSEANQPSVYETRGFLSVG